MRTLPRLFLLLFFGSAFASALATTQTGATQLPFQLKQIAPKVWAAIDDAKGDAGANAGFVIGDDGVAVIDSFENEAAARAMLSEIRRITPLPIKFVINTHYHLDHVAGNAVFVKQGAAIVGHQSIRAWIHTENLKFFGDKITPAQKSLVEHLLAPEVVYDSGVTLYLGSRRIDVLHFEGHTGGDSVVNIPDTGVVFCGDLFWRKTLPNLIDATTSAWISTLDDIPNLPANVTPGKSADRATIFVPGHGDVGNGGDVKDFQAYLVNLRTLVQPLRQAGKKGDDLVAAAMPELSKNYGNWDFFKDFSRSNILDMGAELQGDKRVPLRSQN
jgi:cyclase